MPRPKRLTILTAFFAPETNAAARRLTAAAEHFRDAGWEVTVVTQAPHHPENRVMAGYGEAWRTTREERGIHVTRFAPLLVPPDRVALRLVSELSFAAKAWVQALTSRPDVVLATSPYMFLGPAGLLAARMTRARFAWDVRDLTWKYVRATGRRAFGFDRILEAVMAFTAQHADALTTATRGQLDQLRQVGRAGRAVITNGLTEAFMTDLREGRPRTADGRFTVVYAGLLGFPQGLSTLIDAAARLPDARFILAGGGPESGLLKERAHRLGLTNVEFPGHLDFASLRDLYASSDVLVGMLRGSDAFKVAQPSKVWEYMATGKPVVFAGDCEATTIMQERGIGVVVPPEDDEALARALSALANDPDERARLGRGGFEFVAKERDRGKILEAWERLLETLA